jgi:tetratricopeptide (TPR) repeat protein
VEALAGRAAQAEELLLRALDAAVVASDDGARAAIGSTLVHVMLDAGREEEARQLLEDVSRNAAADDVVTQVSWRSAQARVLASSGRTDDARELARQAIRLAEQTDLMGLRADALLALAEVLLAEGRPNEGVPFARRALRALERRGAAIPAGRARAMLESLGHPAAGPPAGLPAMPPATSEETGSPASADEAAVDEEPAGSPDETSDVAFQEPPPSPFADIAFRRADHPQPAEHPASPPEPRAERANESSWWSFGRR